MKNNQPVGSRLRVRPVGHIQIHPKSSNSSSTTVQIDKIEDEACYTTTTISKTKTKTETELKEEEEEIFDCSNSGKKKKKKKKKCHNGRTSSSPAGSLGNKHIIIRNGKNCEEQEEGEEDEDQQQEAEVFTTSTTITSVGGNSNSRRIFTAEFKKSVVDAFTYDPECIGNQRATARKFRIHRRQVQKWIQQRSPIKISSDERSKTETSIPPSSGLKSFILKESVMANAINTLLSLRDAVRIKAPWSPQGPSSSSPNLTALNLGLLSNSASMMMNERSNGSPPLIQANTPNGSKNTTPVRDSPRRSPRISPQSAASNSPSSGKNHHHHNNHHLYSGLTNGHLLNHDNEPATSAEILDEVTYLYPQEDYTLLRNAILKHEITLTKLNPRLHHHHHQQYGNYPSAMTPSPSAIGSSSNNNNTNNNGNTNGNYNNNNNNHSSGSSSGNLKDDLMTQQTLQLIKQQNEYVQMLQQSGVSLPVFPGDMTMGGSLNLPNLTDHHHSNSKYPPWFHPLAHAAAAAAAAGMTTQTTTGNGNSTTTNGNGKKKLSSSSDSHMFVSPKTPVSSGGGGGGSGSSKPKTVAAALAASRLSPNNIIGNIMGNGPGKVKKVTAPRKRQQRPRSSTITRPPTRSDDDEMDPTSMLEVTTSPSNDYCMDLTTTSASSSSPFIRNESITTFATASSRRHHQNEPISYVDTEGGGLHNSSSPPLSLTTNNNNNTVGIVNSKSNGHNVLSAASLTLENYLRNILPNKKSNPINSEVEQQQQPPTTTIVENSNLATVSDSDRKKQQVLEAFNYDPEVAGDARGVARKFGLNIRVVLKWLREGGPSKSLPALPSALLNKPNGGINLIMDNPTRLSVTANLNFDLSPLSNEQNIISNGSGFNKTVPGSISSANTQKKLLPNKRKNTKPNQICDFQNDDLPDDSDSLPLDMVVPIKKRRVSNSNSSAS